MIISLFSATLGWVILSALISFAGVLLTGQIPFFGLGIFLACMGILTHMILIFYNSKPAWWKIGILYSAR